MHACSELLGLREIGEFRLHPDRVGVRRVGNSAVDRTLAAALQTVVALAGSWGVPVKGDVDAGNALSDSPRFGVGFAFYFGQEAGREFCLVDVHPGVDSVDYGVGKELQVGLGCPGVFDGLQFGAVFACPFRGDHEVVEGLEGGVGGAKDVGVVAGVDGGGYEGRGFGVSAGDGEEVGAWGC